MRIIFRTPSKFHKFGEWIRAKEYEICVHQAVEQEYILPRQTKRILYVEVEYRNQNRIENLSCRRNQWHLFCDDGYNFEPQGLIGGGEPYYRHRPYFGGDRTISPGRNLRGWIAFDIPYEKKPHYLQFSTAFIRTATAEIELEGEILLDEPRDLTHLR